MLLNAHFYMVKVSQVDEREIFKICLEYWLRLVADLYEEIQSLPINESGLLMALNLGPAVSTAALTGGAPLRKDVYAEVLHQLRIIVIEHMVKPEEVRLRNVACEVALNGVYRCSSWRMRRAKSCAR